MKKLFFRLYFGGMSNVRMSLDIAVGLAYLTRRTLAPYDIRPLDVGHIGLLRPGIDFTQYSTLLDLFDVPVPVTQEVLRQQEVSGPGIHRLHEHDLVKSVFFTRDTMRMPPACIVDFCNNRPPACRFGYDHESDSHEHLQMDGRTLANHSYLFCLPDTSKQELNRLMSGIDAKPDYLELAELFSRRFGDFNALHLRRGDFLAKQFTPRVNEVTPNEIIGNVSEYFERDDPLVICTDSPDDRDFLGPIRDHFRNSEIIDTLLINDSSYTTALKQLPFHDNAVVSLMGQLIASHAKTFIGTMYSSYTSMIQRRRGYHRGDRRFLYCYNDFGKSVRFEHCQFQDQHPGTYSWNRIGLPLFPRHLSWCREWPEVFEGI